MKNSNNKNLHKASQEKKDNDLYIFTKDYVFNSPSAASDIILGNSTSGWKNKNGKTLEEIYKK